MKEFIEELKYNQKNNLENKIENNIAIGYVISRLEEINNSLLKNAEYFTYHNKNLTNEQDYRIEEIYNSLVDKGVFKGMEL